MGFLNIQTTTIDCASCNIASLQTKGFWIYPKEWSVDSVFLEKEKILNASLSISRYGACKFWKIQ
jgi:hypothetical protein